MWRKNKVSKTANIEGQGKRKWEISTYGEKNFNSSEAVGWVVKVVGQCKCVCTLEIHAVQEAGATRSEFVFKKSETE